MPMPNYGRGVGILIEMADRSYRDYPLSTQEKYSAIWESSVVRVTGAVGFKNNPSDYIHRRQQSAWVRDMWPGA